jgi:hypothetical protein
MKAMVLAALCLLATVSSVCAEGAWVLWLQSWALGTGRFKDGMPMMWTTVTGTNSSGQCDQVRQARMKEFAKGTFREADHMLILDSSNPKVDYRAFIDIGAIEEGTRQKWESEDREKGTLTLYVNFSCLPDTVDPRGPKGK